jgi:hypothetical protein
MKAVTDALGIARSNVAARIKGQHPRRGPQNRDGDAELSADIRRFVDARPTYGYRRIAALINRERRSGGLSGVNSKRIYRLMQKQGLLLSWRLTPAGGSPGNTRGRWRRSNRICAGGRTAWSLPAEAARSCVSPSCRTVVTERHLGRDDP